MSVLSRREFFKLTGTTVGGLIAAELGRPYTGFYEQGWAGLALAGEKLRALELLREFDPSIYPAGDNDMGRIDDGAVIVNPEDFNDYYRQAMQQFRDHPQASYQDYAVSMEATALPTKSDGSPRLPKYPEIYQPDFWLKDGFGLGFDEITPVIHGAGAVLASEVGNLLTLSTDGIARGHFIVPQEELWHAMIHSLRSIYQIRFGGSLDLKKYGPKTDLAKLDAELHEAFRQSVNNVGYERVRSTRWPGPADLNKVAYNIVGEGRVCIAKRPKNSLRVNQVPELFSEAWYREWVEKRAEDNDERPNLIDVRSDVELLVLFDPGSTRVENSYRFVVLGDDSPADSLRPLEKHDLADNFPGDVRVRRARWVPCGKPKPGAEASPTPSPQPTQARPSEGTPPPRSPRTPGPGETPGTPGTPVHPPETPKPPETPQIPDSTPQNSEPTQAPGPIDAGTPAVPPPIADTPAPEVVVTPPQNPTPDSNQTPLAP